MLTTTVPGVPDAVVVIEDEGVELGPAVTTLVDPDPEADPAAEVDAGCGLPICAVNMAKANAWAAPAAVLALTDSSRFSDEEA